MTLRRRSFLTAWRLDRKKLFFWYNLITYTCKLLTKHQILVFCLKVSVVSDFCITFVYITFAHFVQHKNSEFESISLGKPEPGEIGERNQAAGTLRLRGSQVIPTDIQWGFLKRELTAAINGPWISAFCPGRPKNDYLPTCFCFLFECIMEHQKKRWSSLVWANGHPDGYFIGQVGEMYCRPLEEDVSPRDWKHPYRFDAFGTESRHRNIF